MNSRQRQFILLTWLMVMLSIVLVFLLTYAPESPVDQDADNKTNLTYEDDSDEEDIKRGFALPGIFGDAYNGLVQLYRDFVTGASAIGDL